MKLLRMLVLAGSLLGACTGNEGPGPTLGYTGREKRYTLEQSGTTTPATLLLRERTDGTTTLGLQAPGLPDGAEVVLRFGSLADPGNDALLLNALRDGASETTVTRLASSEAIRYDQLLTMDGHLLVRRNGTTLAGADIGGNELTGEQLTRNLAAPTGEGVSGTVTIARRKNGYAKVSVQLAGTASGAQHPAHFHLNQGAGLCGSVSITLNDVNGGTGRSESDVRALDGDVFPFRNSGSPLTYDLLVSGNRCVEIHLSANQLGTIIANG